MISVEQYGPWALVTGGSEGLGAAFAHELAKSGINQVLLARREGPLQDTAEQIRSTHGVEVRTLSVDISADNMLDRVRDVTDDIEVGTLISNIGGLFAKGPYLNCDHEDVLKTVRAIPMAHAALSHHFGQPMLKRGRGGIILVGSLAGSAGGATMIMYSAGKAFAQKLAEGLWAETEGQGLHVAYLVVGSTDTPARAREAGPVAPGQEVDDPHDLARFALNNIAEGPVLVPPRLAEAFKMFGSMPRRQAAETMRAMLTGQLAN